MDELHLNNRNKLLSVITREIFGPIDDLTTAENNNRDGFFHCDPEIPPKFESYNEYNSVRPVLKESNQEIIKDERPTNRYGMGILFPADKNENQDSGANENINSLEVGPQVDSEVESGFPELKKPKNNNITSMIERSEYTRLREEDDEALQEKDFVDLRNSNRMKQQSIGISFVIDTSLRNPILIDVRGAVYKKIKGIKVGDSEYERTWWARFPLIKKKKELLDAILNNGDTSIDVSDLVPQFPDRKPIALWLEILVRDRSSLPIENYNDHARLVTVTLVNRTAEIHGEIDQLSIFQAGLKIYFEKGESPFLPYPEPVKMNDEFENLSLALLNRNEKIYCAGHGCAGIWEVRSDISPPDFVSAEPLPVYEIPSVTPELSLHKSNKSGKEILSIPIYVFAFENKIDEAFEILQIMLDGYEEWINSLEMQRNSLEKIHKETAGKNIEQCRLALERMKSGLSLLKNDPSSKISEAFRFANRAMLMQGLQSSIKKRDYVYDKENRRAGFSGDYSEISLESDEAISRRWRPFQIAFLLMNIEGMANPSSESRGIVDLVWFPTGGGKTEAYLACASFSMFYRRLIDKEDYGTDVIMRYTLRLLTAQQFQRAATLICSMEVVRRENIEKFGENPFSIGIWVGGATTPNKVSYALSNLNQVSRNGRESFNLILLQCPWCSAEMGPVKNTDGRAKYKVLGFEKSQGSLRIHCHDNNCRFHSRLPVNLIDEEIFKNPPTYLIATVDKFASLAWNSMPRSIFGIGNDGKRKYKPPGMIIQDELHLINGPLGSMVGLYEMLLDELSTDRRNSDRVIKPKLICATATTRASSRQIRELYARKKVDIFPPPGIEIGDSFFAKYDRKEDGSLKPGRKYLGVLPINFPSAQTATIRVFSPALSAAEGFENNDEKDPWWTLLLFYNSLRELGSGLSLFLADIPERMRNLHSRLYSEKEERFLDEPLELTGRIDSSDVPASLDALSRKVGDKPIDFCLASNIIEVGVDIDRLSLMGVIGQPKGTAQYIQATGRIGRRIPGLVITVYNATKARDRSHYEQFQSYHSRLYAQVEPASVTPFTLPILKRALHSVLCGWIQQNLDIERLEHPEFTTDKEELYDEALQILETRIKEMDYPQKDEERMIKDLMNVGDQRRSEWANINADVWVVWFPTMNEGNEPLFSQTGTPKPRHWQSWDLPTSMRGVDAECGTIIPLSDEH